jgi:hypothetical protein
MKKTTGLLICILLLHYSATAQSFAINTDGTAAHASAILDVKSTAKGLLIPRMTKTERNSIITPATGLMIFQTGPDSIGFHYYSGSTWNWVSSSNGSDWKLTGNTGTNPAANFIGTLDNQPLCFRVNNVWAGMIDPLTAQISLGVNSFRYSSGINNIAIGTQSMRYNFTGSFNTAVGGSSLYENSVGNYNIALGYYALSANVSGNNNTATGVNALQQSRFGSDNTAYGYFSLTENRTGNNNTAIGNNALRTNKYGSNNSAIGYFSDVLDSNYTNATAIGSRAAVNCSNCLVLGSVNGTNNAVSNVNVGIGTTTPQASLHVKRGAVLFDSTIGSTPKSGAGTRMMWIPAKAAFRGGQVTGAQWDDVNIGYYSTAMGYNTYGSGYYSTAMGSGSDAFGDYSTAMGGGTRAYGINSTAMGSGSEALGDYSTAMGGSTFAIGNYSTAMGLNTNAIGEKSTTMGWNSNASGVTSTAIGYFIKSKSFGGFVTGLYNDTTNAASPTSINSLNRIFQIGNGTADNVRSNAMTVLQNGNIGIGELIPTSPLNFASTVGDKIALWGNGANHYGLGIQASLMQVYTMDAGNDIAFGYGNSAAFTENVRIKGNGNVGIGTVNPVVPLNFSTNLGDKIAFWSNGTNHYGIGLQPSLLQLYTEASSSDIAFGYGNSAAFTENLRIKGNGNVGIGTNTPSELLDVNGTTTTNGLQVSNGTIITKMQSGSVTVGANVTGQLVYVINFPVAFATAFPRVFATARNAPATNFGDAFSVSVRSVSATSVTLNIQRTDTNAGWGQLLRIDWFAVE